RRAAFHGRTVRPLAGEAHDAAHRLRDEIETAPMPVRPGATEPGERAIDQGRIVLAQLLVAKAEPLHHTGREILDEHVSLADQPAQDLRPAWRLQVERATALLPVHHPKGPP